MTRMTPEQQEKAASILKLAATLVWRHYPGMPPDDKEEVIHDACIYAAVRHDPERGQIGTYLTHAIMAVVHLMRSRQGAAKRSRLKGRSLSLCVEAEPSTAPDSVIDEVIRREEVEAAAARARTLFRQLNPRHRDMLKLRYIDGLPGKEVARRLGVSATRVWDMRKQIVAKLTGRSGDACRV